MKRRGCDCDKGVDASAGEIMGEIRKTMKNGIHFISGLPRAGSTLLSAVLRQNPIIHAGMSSPVSGLCQRLIFGMGPQSEYSSLITDQQRRNLLHALFEGYYKDVHGEKLVIDTSRMWCSKMPMIANLYPKARVIVCVRELHWVIDSFERILRRNPFIMSKMFQKSSGSTVFTRVANLASPMGTVGFAWNALREAFYGEFADQLILIDYEALTRDPQRAMDFLYTELDLPPFAHDFNNVSYTDGDNFDQQLGVAGLHSVGRAVRFVERPSILPPELIERFTGHNFWRRRGVNKRNVKILLPENTGQVAPLGRIRPQFSQARRSIGGL
jgi:sulfotransferase